jgi:nucleoside-diphosphate-sugar epimerase
MPHLFIFGLGFSARVIARRLLAEGWSVAGTTRSGEAVDDLPGVTIHPFDRDHPLPDSALAGATHVLSSVPPDALGDPVLDRLGPGLAALNLTWAGYLSTTGIYGDTGGAWVDETTEPQPTLDRSRRRLAAENAWCTSGLPVHVFRLGGIYGPGRSAIDSVRDGTAKRIVKPGQVFGRIHVDDIAQIVRGSMAAPAPGAIYNAVDDDPAPPQDVILHACRLLNVDPPPEIPWDQAHATLSPMALSFYADSKRVRNERIKAELGVSLIYPTYREGLAAILGLSP